MPTLSMVLATLIWGLSYIFIKIVLQELSPSMFICLRFLIASICALPIFIFYRPRFKRLDIVRGVKLGLLLVGINFFQTIGMQTISASLSAFLTGSAVVFVLFIKLIAQKRLPKPLDILMVLACVVGLGLVTGGSGVVWGAGVCYTLVCALFVALHTYVLSDYVADGDPWVLTFLQMAVLSIVAACAAFVLDGNVYLPTQPMTWWALVLCAVLCSTVAFGMQAYAQQYISAFEASVILTLEPIFTVFFARFTLDEVLNLQFYIGASIILAAILLVNIRMKQID
ncbi:MAG: DMT family transporter [Bacteroidota bacterium]